MYAFTSIQKYICYYKGSAFVFETTINMREIEIDSSVSSASIPTRRITSKTIRMFVVILFPC